MVGLALRRFQAISKPASAAPGPARARASVRLVDAVAQESRRSSATESAARAARSRRRRSEQAGIGKGWRQALDRISEAALLAHSWNSRDDVPAAERVGRTARARDSRGRARRRPAKPKANGPVRLAPVDADAAGEARRPSSGTRPSAMSPKEALGEIDELLGSTCRPRRGSVARRDIAGRASRADPPASTRADARLVAEHRAAERLVGEGRSTARRRSGPTACRVTSPSSCSTTSFSRSRSSASKCGRRTRSAISSTAERHMLGHQRGRERRSGRARSQALSSPPTSSIASLSSRAERPPAPLNTICSKMCARPLRCAGS